MVAGAGDDESVGGADGGDELGTGDVAAGAEIVGQAGELFAAEDARVGASVGRGS